MSIKSIAVVMTVAAGFAGLMAFGSDRFIAIKSPTHPPGELEAGSVLIQATREVQQGKKTNLPSELSRAQIEHDVVHTHSKP